jgi:hypothetical protein
MNPDQRLLFVLLVVTGLAIGALIAYLTELSAEREFIAYVYQPLKADPLSPADLSALIEEARRITGEA